MTIKEDVQKVADFKILCIVKINKILNGKICETKNIYIYIYLAQWKLLKEYQSPNKKTTTRGEKT